MHVRLDHFSQVSACMHGHIHISLQRSPALGPIFTFSALLPRSSVDPSSRSGWMHMIDNKEFEYKL